MEVYKLLNSLNDEEIAQLLNSDVDPIMNYRSQFNLVSNNKKELKMSYVPINLQKFEEPITLEYYR